MGAKKFEVKQVEKISKIYFLALRHFEELENNEENSSLPAQIAEAVFSSEPP
jgi:hypothetical protein